MQDLFQLGNLLQETGTTSTTGRSGRHDRSSNKASDLSGEPTFDALLALAAAFGKPAPERHIPSEPAPGNHSNALDTTVDPVGIRNLLATYSLQPTETTTDNTNTQDADAGTLVSFADKGQPAAFDLLFMKSIAEPESGQAGNMEQLENGRESVDTSHSIGDEGQSAADIERFDRWRDEWLRPDTIGTRRLDAGASTEPNLSIVARNEHPIRSWMSDSSSPDLRVIEVGGEAASIPAGDDLLDRLAGTWEQSFLPNADDAFATEHSLDFIPDFPANDHLRLIEGQNHIPARQADGGEDGMIRPLLDRLSEAAVEPLESSDARSRDASTGERSWAPGTPADDPAIRVSPAPIPLFGDFLPVDVESLPATNPEPAITARQAVMEVASELQHLARTGGSELSFSLRLHPEHLGHIEVEIQRTNDVWSISIVAAHEEARDVLAAEISRLEHRFRDQNLTLDAITVVTKPSESAIIAPFAGEQTASTEFQHSGQPGFAGERNQDESG